MVRHADKGAGFQHLKYATRPHFEYRTVIHVTVQMLQPKTNVPDAEGWQRVADIFNHVFADDLETQNVRLQGGKHWRDQYVHRYANSRPAEWKTICQPDEEQSEEEMVRRGGYRRRIEDAARNLSIQFPASTTAQPQPSATQIVKRKASSILERRAVSSEVDDAAPKLKAHKQAKRGSTAHAVQSKGNDGSGEKWLEEGKGYAEVGEEDDNWRGQTYEQNLNRSLPDQGFGRPAHGHPAPSHINNFQMNSSIPTFPNTGYGERLTMGDEALARTLQEEEARGQRRRTDAGPLNYKSMSSDDEEELPALPAVDQKPSTKRLRHKPAGVTFAQLRKEEAQRRKTADQVPTAAPKGMDSSKGVRDDKDISTSSLNSSGLPNSTSSTSTSSDPPPLPMIHGGSLSTNWIDGIPHAFPSTSESGRPAAILRPSSLLIKRGGKVMRGVLDEKEQDVMLCLADECSWCDPISANSTVVSTARTSFNLPLVHSCCIKQDEQSGVEKFVQDEGVKFEWEERFPNHVRRGKVLFSDGVTRDVFVCEVKKCETCQELDVGGKMKE